MIVSILFANIWEKNTDWKLKYSTLNPMSKSVRQAVTSAKLSDHTFYGAIFTSNGFWDSQVIWRRSTNMHIKI